MNRSHTFQVLISVSNLSFLLLFGFTCYQNGLRADDFHFLSNINTYGIWDGMIHEYSTWSSRYMSVLVNHNFLWLEQKTGWGLLLFGLLSLVMTTSAIHSLLLRVTDRAESNLIPGQLQNWRMSLFLTSIIFYLTPNIGETWFWLCSACTYLWSAIAAIYLVSWLLHSHPKVLHHLLGLIACIYVGGSSGPLALLMLFLIPFWIIFSKGTKWSVISWARFIIAWSALALSFYILFKGGGNIKREAFFDNITIVHSFWLNFKMCGILILRVFRYQTIGLAVILSITSFYLFLNNFKEILRSWTAPTIVLGIGLFFYQWPITYKTQDIAAIRALLPVTILLTLYLIVIFQRTRIALSPTVISVLKLSIPLVVLCAGLVHLYIESSEILYTTRPLLDE